MSISLVQRRRASELLFSFLTLAGLRVQLAEAKVTLGDERVGRRALPKGARTC